MERDSFEANDAFSATGSDFLERTVDGDPMGFVYGQLEKSSLTLYNMSQIARFLDPPASLPGLIPESQQGRAFLHGEILGKTVSREFLSPPLSILTIRELTKINPIVPAISGTSYLARLQRRNTILDRAALGWDMSAPYYSELFNHWDSALTMTEEEPSSLRLGFGLIMKLTYDAWEEEFKSIYDEESIRADLDAELKRIFKEES